MWASAKSNRMLSNLSGSSFFWLLIIFSRRKVFCAKSLNCSKREINFSLMGAGRSPQAVTHACAINWKFSKAFYEGRESVRIGSNIITIYLPLHFCSFVQTRCVPPWIDHWIVWLHYWEQTPRTRGAFCSCLWGTFWGLLQMLLNLFGVK